MFSFEGKYRRTPGQSLGGASQTVEKESLIKKFQDQRNKREDERRKQSSAIKIQSCFRSYITRKFQSDILRREFDTARNSLEKNSSVDHKTLYEMICRLAYFYKPQDGQRLIFIFQELLKKGFDYIKTIDNIYNNGLLHLKQILHLSIKYLRCIAARNEPIALPMRILELFLSPINKNDNITLSGFDSNFVFSSIIYHIVKSGYFVCLKELLKNKVPSSIEKSSTPPTPIASSLFNLIMIPVQFITITSNKELGNFVMKSMSKVFLCEKFSEQIESFLLPAFTNSHQFPFEHLIDSLISFEKVKDELHTIVDITPSPYLLSSLLTLSQNFISVDIKNCVVIKYIKLLDILLSSLIPLNKHQYMTTDSDNEDDDFMEHEDEKSIEMMYLREEILQQLNSTCQIKCFINCLRSNSYNIDVVQSVCSICYKLMAVHMVSINKMRLLYTLSLHSSFVYNIWNICKALSTETCTGSTTSLLSMLGKGLPMYESDKQRIICILYVFCAMFSHSLITLHDAEFYGEERCKLNSQYAAMPFSLSELVPMSYYLRDACLGILDLAHPDIKHSINDEYQHALVHTFNNRKSDQDIQDEEKKTWICLFKVVVVLVRQLYNRDTRRRFCPKTHWLSSHVTVQANRVSISLLPSVKQVIVSQFFFKLSLNTTFTLYDESPPLANRDVRNLIVLTEIPFVISFAERFKILQRLIMANKEENQSEMTNFLVGPSINIAIRRDYVYEDAFDKLSPENEANLKLKMRVQLRNAAGLDEAGIDGGGVFREFLTHLLKTAFDPNRGFFQYTTDRLIYPNPHASQLEDNYIKHYYFIGRMLGKAIYENMLVELPFASFFLAKILSSHGFNLDIHYLQSLDPVMYRNLLSLKNEIDVSELGLDFSVIDNSFGENKIIELKPGGRNIPVTNENKIEYVHLMADYKVNRQIHSHCAAFRQGMADVISLEWLQMFDHHEFQILISGTSTPINIDDLRHNTSYSGGFSETHPVIELFWKVVASFTDQQKSQLLKFVTSCSQQPLLGFKDLYPPFCIHDAGTDLDRLPTASTCMNLLKLPHFTDESLLRNKLLYAIESNAGFELS
ncbi:hypothetical protein LOTGIDRAFT_111732 [Lottia gigantea]|uniref:Ubiquitin-protein ligase E3C n=1 Tax=Lottia gigantea TaxID=225164 RepID=V4B5L0_LOTGI|nr:hypothetical protein LOTGIDRAFT_111732 [Lottia gigantea]ESP01317.1 hypothetical protein LOTGIDRAFT_111732 [Lottia gigantea]